MARAGNYRKGAAMADNKVHENDVEKAKQEAAAQAALLAASAALAASVVVVC